MAEYLSNKLLVSLHPDKIYIQPYRKGVKFIGSVVKGNRIYISNSTISNAYIIIHRFNHNVIFDNIEHIVQSLNSYWGFMKHYNSYNVKVKIFKNVNYEWFKYIRYNAVKHKFEIRNQFKEHKMILYYSKRKEVFCEKFYSFT